METLQIAEQAKEYAKSLGLDDDTVTNSKQQMAEYAEIDFIAGAKWMNKQWQELTRWIPVEERLPEKGRSVLIKLIDDEDDCWISEINEDGYWDYISPLNVTHWREIIE